MKLTKQQHALKCYERFLVHGSRKQEEAELDSFEACEICDEQLIVKSVDDLCWCENCGVLVEDYTEDEYEVALEQAGFTRDDFPGHVVTTFADGTTGHICEAAAQDMFDTRREVLADLIGTRDWEDECWRSGQ